MGEERETVNDLINKIAVGLIQNSNLKIIAAYFTSDGFNRFIQCVEQGECRVIELPKPLDDIRIVCSHPSQIYKNFQLEVLQGGYHREGNVLIPNYSKEIITGDAYLLI